MDGGQARASEGGRADGAAAPFVVAPLAVPLAAEGDEGGKELGKAAHNQTDVYVCVRPFRSWRALPHAVGNRATAMMCDVGLGHYMIYLRDAASGTALRLDFGPVGGEVGLTSQKGEVRVRPENADVFALPTVSYVGRSKLNVDEVVALARTACASRHGGRYELMRNDCRHFANALCLSATGFQNASHHAVRARHAELARRKVKDALGKLPPPMPANPLLDLGWWCSNVENAAPLRGMAAGAAAVATAHCAISLARVGPAVPALAVFGAASRIFEATRNRVATRVAAGMVGAGAGGVDGPELRPGTRPLGPTGASSPSPSSAAPPPSSAPAPSLPPARAPAANARAVYQFPP